jgi:hypothetical protein
MPVADTHYDRHQFDRAPRAVSAKTGISFADMTHGMHVTDYGGVTHKSRRNRRWIPEYAADMDKIRKVVAVLLFLNSTEGKVRDFSQVEAEFNANPLGFIHKYEDIVRERAAKTKWDVARMGDGAKRSATRERAVAAFGYGKLLLSVLHLSFREGMSSTEVSQALTVKLSPQGVRQWLCRAATIARKLYGLGSCPPLHWTARADYHLGKGLNRNNQTDVHSKGPRRAPDYRVAEFEAYGLLQEFTAVEVADQLGISKHMVRVLALRHRNRRLPAAHMKS